MTTPDPNDSQPTIRPPGESESQEEHQRAIEQAGEERMRHEHPEEVIERDRGDVLLEPGQIG